MKFLVWYPFGARREIELMSPAFHTPLQELHHGSGGSGFSNRWRHRVSFEAFMPVSVITVSDTVGYAGCHGSVVAV